MPPRESYLQSGAGPGSQATGLPGRFALVRIVVTDTVYPDFLDRIYGESPELVRCTVSRSN